MGTDEEGTLARLKAHRRELVDTKIAEHRGRIVKTTGDGMLVEFASVVDALRCAVDAQDAMSDRSADVPVSLLFERLRGTAPKTPRRVVLPTHLIGRTMIADRTT